MFFIVYSEATPVRTIVRKGVEIESRFGEDYAKTKHLFHRILAEIGSLMYL